MASYSRLVAQGSGIAFAAVLAAAVPAPHQASVAPAPAAAQTGASSVSPAANRHLIASHFVSFDDDDTGLDIRHRWP